MSMENIQRYMVERRENSELFAPEDLALTEQGFKFTGTEDIAEEAPPVGNEQAPVTDGSQAPGFIDSVKNVGTNIGDIPDMAIRGILRAGGEAAFSSGLIDEDTANKWRGMLDASGEIAEKEGVNPMVRGLGEGLSQFGAGMYGPFKAMMATGRIARPVAALIAEGLSGAFAFNPDDPNLGNFINSFEGRPEWLGAIADFIQTDPNDPSAENRFRNVIQDVVPSAFIEGVVKAVSKVRGMDEAELVKAGEEAEQKIEAAAPEIEPQPTVLDEAVPEPVIDPAPVFYSAVANAVDALPMEKGSASQMRAMIAKSAEVKPEEMAWIGLDDFLKGKKNVTKQEIKDFVAANQVRIEEVTRRADGPNVEDETLNWLEAEAVDDPEYVSMRADEMIDAINQGETFDLDEVLSELIRMNPQRYPASDVTWRNKLEQHFADGGTVSDLDGTTHADMVDAAQSMQQKYYDEQPYTRIRHDSIDGGEYEILGSEDTGYIIKLDGVELKAPRTPGQLDREHHAYHFNTLEEAKIHALNDAYDEGILRWGSDEMEGDTRWIEYTLGDGVDVENYREVVLHLPETQSGYKSHAFPERNILSWLRLTDRTGPDNEKVLFIEEIQSDWHQAGFKQGYKPQKLADRLNALRDFPARRLEELSDEVIIKEMAKAFDYSIDYATSLFNAAGRNTILSEIIHGVPDAPLKKTWHEMAFRRIARMAAEEGYDAIAWTPSKLQLARYPGAEKRYDKIEVTLQAGHRFSTRDGSEYYEVSGRAFENLSGGLARSNKGMKVIKRDVKKEDLPKVIGQEATDKIFKNWVTEGEYGVLENVDVKVGGKRLKDLYDKKLKQYANKFGKKFNSKVGVMEIADPPHDVPVWSMPVTEKMKTSLMKKGVATFGVAGVAAGASEGARNDVNRPN